MMLDGKVAVVSGAGRGIGRAHALRLAAYGAYVVVNDPGVAIDGRATSDRPADEVVAEIVSAGGEAIADHHDVATMRGGEAPVQAALDRWGGVDIVVCNAGIGRPRMVFNLSEDDWDEVVRVHLKGTFAVARPACVWWRSEAKAGRPRPGRLITTSTGLLTRNGAGQSNYVAAKAGVAAFTEALATEMAPYGVTANCIMPGARTRLASVGWRIDAMESEREAFDSSSPDHVAELMCYLASDEADWVSGQCFEVRGGHVELAMPWTNGPRLERSDRGFTAADLAHSLSELFPPGTRSGPRPADKPPPGWRRPGDN
jgi:NAD(P)-dependent dehydrogenase (short-subunit alcohol dehydrogenase family)